MLQGASSAVTRTFGKSKSKTIGPKAGVYNFGVTKNITRLLSGLSANKLSALSSVGTGNFFNFLGDFATLQMARVQSALLDGALGSASVAANTSDSTTPGGQALIAGQHALQAATSDLVSKIAARLGVDSNSQTALYDRLIGNSVPSVRGRPLPRVVTTTQGPDAISTGKSDVVMPASGDVEASPDTAP